MRKPLIAANWKMHKTIADATEFLANFLQEAASIDHVDIILAPPHTALQTVAGACRDTNIATAAQNIHWETHGAYTGEISAEMAREAGANHAIIGHSERRQYFGEDDYVVNRKIRASLNVGLTPIVCIGETLSQRERSETHVVLEQQLDGALQELSTEEIQGIIVAYEPVWAIGTGRTATPEQAQDTHRHIREHLGKIGGKDASNLCRLLYGGSVKSDNSAELCAKPDVDGALVGGASLDPKHLLTIVLNSRNNTSK